MPNKTIIYLSILAISIGLIFLANGLILAWSPPTAPPPDENVPAPLNVGVDGQSKIGGLILNTGGAPNGLIIQNGNVGIGTTGPEQKLHIVGTGYATGDFRAPIFYDTNNTGYYVDPAGTSKFNIINLGGVSRSTWPSGGCSNFGSVTRTLRGSRNTGTNYWVNLGVDFKMASASGMWPNGAADCSAGVTEKSGTSARVNVTANNNDNCRVIISYCY